MKARLRVFLALAIILINICVNCNAEYAPYNEKSFCQYEVDGKVGLRNINGTVLIAPNCDYISPWFYEGIARFCRDGKIGYYNTDGEIISNAQWNAGADFSEGRAAVTDDAGYIGFIDCNGECIIQTKWFACPYQSFSDGLALVVDENSQYYYIDVNGEKVLALSKGVEGTQFEQGYALTRFDVGDGFDYSVINRQGDTIQSFHSDMYDVILAEGYVMWTNGGNVTYSSLDGHIILSIDNCFEARPLREGYAFVKLKDKLWKCYDIHGEEIFSIKKDALLDGFSNGYAAAYDFDDSYVSYYDKTGEVVSKIIDGGKLLCNRISYYDKTAEQYGYLDSNFSIVIKPQWSTASDFADELAIVSTENGKRYVINMNGDIVAKAE